MRILPLLTLATGALFLVLVSPPLSADDAVELKRHWIAGKRYQRTSQTHLTSTALMGASLVEMESNTTTQVSETVNPPKGGQGKSVTIRNERLVTETNMNGKKIRYDSANPGAADTPPELARRMGKHAGTETTYLLDDRDNFAGLVPAKASESSASSPAQPRGLSKEMVADLLQKSGIQGLPDHPVKPGDTWPFTYNSNLPQAGQVAVNGIYTFKGVSTHAGVPCAEITSEGEMAMDFSKLAPDNPASKAGLKLEKATAKSTIWFDVNLGTVRECSSTQNLQVTMKNPANPDTTMSRPIEMQFHTELTKIEDAP